MRDLPWFAGFPARVLFTAVLACTCWTPAWSVAATGPDSAVARLIHQAGSTDQESERLRLLRELQQHTDLSPALKTELNRLLPIVEAWADGKSRQVPASNRAAENGYLCYFITSKVRPTGEGPIHPPEPAPDSPLRPIWALYRGRMLIWQVIQSGPLLRVQESREKYYGEGRRLLNEASKAYPENRVIRMYLGEQLPWPKEYPADPGAPVWANLQRESLEKLADIIHWWIAERQLTDGQFGGGWGDDVEMWRWWTPILIGFDDPRVNEAQARLSSGIFNQPDLRQGFTARVTDVEHSNEDTTDTILPMMHLQSEDPVWKARAVRLAELMRERWTGKNERGHLQFKSIYFSVDKVDTSPDRAFDTVYHTTIVQPALLYWQRTADPQLTQLFGEWMRSWIDATARAENGKPAGVIPSAVRWPDGGIAKPGQPWWEPFSAGHNDALYNWPGVSAMMTSTLLLTYHLTGESKYLDPIRSMATIAMQHRNAPEGNPGSEAWCARRISGFLPETLAKYRFLTGDTQYDPWLRSGASGYVSYRLTGDPARLEAALRRNAEAFRSNWEGYTSEMRWTDRVMDFTRNYLSRQPGAAPPVPTPAILYSSLTGDPGTPFVFPLNAVRWRTPPREFAALVTDSSRTNFSAQVFHFGKTPRSLEAEFYLLNPGVYELTLHPADAPAASQQTRLHVQGPIPRVALQLPPGKLTDVRVRPAAAR